MHARRPDQPLVFSHIPKTAGTSLTAALHQALRPEVFFQGMDQCLVGGYDDFAAFDQTAREMMILSPEEIPADAALIAGHIGPATTMARFPDADHITFLRNPAARILSQWMHCRSLTEFDIRHWGPGAEAFRVAWLPLKEYLTHPLVATNTDNTIARFLAWPNPLLPSNDFLLPTSDAAVADAAIARIEAMAHVDLVENPRFITDLGSWLGTETPQTRLNERAYVPKRMRPDFATELDSETRELLAERTRIDVQIWKHVAARVLPDADHEAVLAETFNRAIARYQESFTNTAPTGRPIRRVVAFAYNTLKR